MKHVYLVTGREPRRDGTLGVLKPIREYPQGQWQKAVKFAARLRRQGWPEARVETYAHMGTVRMADF